MNIQEATKKAIEINGYITGGMNKSLRNFIFIKPTDGINLCILCTDKNHSRRGWQPYASDLLSDNWEVVTEEEFLSLSTKNNLF